MSKLCTFSIGNHACALDVNVVREVIRPRAPTPVPHAPEGVVGLVALRGQVLTAVDLGPRLGDDTRTDAPYGIVVAYGDTVFCLLADQVGQVGEAKDERVEPPPASLDPALCDLVAAAYRAPRTLYLVLRPDAILDVTACPAATCE